MKGVIEVGVWNLNKELSLLMFFPLLLVFFSGSLGTSRDYQNIELLFSTLFCFFSVGPFTESLRPFVIFRVFLFEKCIHTIHEKKKKKT